MHSWSEMLGWKQYGMGEMKIKVQNQVFSAFSDSQSSSLPPVTMFLPLLLSLGAWFRALRPGLAPPSFSSSSFFKMLCPSAAHKASASSRSCSRDAKYIKMLISCWKLIWKANLEGVIKISVPSLFFSDGFLLMSAKLI